MFIVVFLIKKFFFTQRACTCKDSNGQFALAMSCEIQILVLRIGQGSSVEPVLCSLALEPVRQNSSRFPADCGEGWSTPGPCIDSFQCVESLHRH